MKRIIIIILLVLVCSCNPKVITQIQRDTTYLYKTNTEYLHDSVTVFKDRIVKEKGDTVYVKETIYKDRWRYKEKTDTLYLEKIKEVEKEVTKEVEKPLTWFRKLFISLGKILSIITVLYIIYLIVYKKLKLKI